MDDGAKEGHGDEIAHFYNNILQREGKIAHQTQHNQLQLYIDNNDMKEMRKGEVDSGIRHKERWTGLDGRVNLHRNVASHRYLYFVIHL